MMRKLGQLLRKDLLTVYRDRMMMMLTAVPMLAAVGLRLLVATAMRYAPSLPPELPILVAPVAAMTSSTMIGFVAGLGLVTERETRTLVSLRVMPLPHWTFLLYQVGWTALFGIALAVLSVTVYGTRPANLPLTVVAVIVTSLTAGATALFLGGLASNRIEALAASKSLNMLMLPSLAVFVTGPAGQLAVAWSPWYWAYLLLLAGFGGGDIAKISVLRWPGYSAPVLILACLAMTAAWVILLGRWYFRRAAA